MTSNPPHLQRITLHLAKGDGFPDGSINHGHLITAPLNLLHHFDLDAWKKVRHLCRTRRFWQGETDRLGLLVHHMGGRFGSGWLLAYRRDDAVDQECGQIIRAGQFMQGETVSIHDEKGTERLFTVARLD